MDERHTLRSLVDLSLCILSNTLELTLILLSFNRRMCRHSFSDSSKSHIMHVLSCCGGKVNNYFVQCFSLRAMNDGLIGNCLGKMLAWLDQVTLNCLVISKMGVHVEIISELYKC